MTQLEQLTEMVTAFRDVRDWKQFHNPKDSSISLNLEAGEVLEHFQWKSKEEIDVYIKEHKDDIGEELADVLYWILLMSNDMGIDIANAFEKKLEKNNEKYPVDRVKGKHTKYNEYK